MAPAQRGWAPSPWGFVRRVAGVARDDNVLFLASALSFDALLAAIPFSLLVLAALGQFVQSGDEALADVLRLLGRLIPTGRGAGDPFRQAERVLTGIAEQRGSLSILGLPLFLLFATRFFNSVRVALNDVFHTTESRSWLRGLGIDVVLVGLTVMTVVINTVLSLRVYGPSFPGAVLANLTTLLLGIALFIAVYMLAPKRKMRWDTAAVAGGVAAVLFGAAKWLYTVYLREFTTVDRLISNENIIALLLLVLWVYYTACAFLLGAEVVDVYEQVSGTRGA